MKTNTVANIIIILSVIGVADSAYSTYEHYQLLAGLETHSFCDLSPQLSCSTVNSSPFSEIFGISVAFLGVLWFIVMMALALQLKAKKSLIKNPEFYLFAWATTGLFTVFWLLYAEYVIGAICLLCTVVHIIVIIILILSYKSLKKPISKYIEDIFYK